MPPPEEGNEEVRTSGDKVQSTPDGCGREYYESGKEEDVEVSPPQGTGDWRPHIEYMKHNRRWFMKAHLDEDDESDEEKPQHIEDIAEKAEELYRERQARKAAEALLGGIARYTEYGCDADDEEEESDEYGDESPDFQEDSAELTEELEFDQQEGDDVEKDIKMQEREGTDKETENKEAQPEDNAENNSSCNNDNGKTNIDSNAL